MEKHWLLESVAADGAHVVTPISQFPFHIGRDADNDLSIASAALSRRHAILTQDISAMMRLTDLNSTNGTFVNRTRIEGSCLLKEGDIIHFGSVEFRLRQQSEQHKEKAFQTDSMRTMLISPNAALSEFFVPHEAEFYALLNGQGLAGAAQPIVRAKNREIFAYELLGRAKMPPLPSSPIRLFELATALDKEVELSAAFREYGLRTIAPHIGETPVFVNTHPKETFTDVFFESLKILQQAHPQLKLVVELHETAITDAPQLRALAHRLQSIGVQLAYDDFGAGQARLNELGEIPPGFVKFDIGLVQRINKASERKRRVVSDLVRLVLDLGSVPLAEGIENEEEATICSEMGFTLFQGYLTGRPIPVENFGK